MFTGIIETLGTIVKVETAGTNMNFTIQSAISSKLKIDQSLSHNGVCLTVVALHEDTHTVTAIDETLQKTNLKYWKTGNKVNLERAMIAGGRLDGHFVQGHVDQVATITNIQDTNGSWLFTLQYKPDKEHMVVNKGSICIDGVSLTVVNPAYNEFSVAIIPYTHEHTLFHQYQIGQTVNLEFDIIGKYFLKYIDLYAQPVKA